jgi:outer membrane protein insertion porin family
MNKNFSRFRLRSVAAVVVSALAATAAWAVEPFTVRDIRVEGLQRVEAGTIFASLPLRVGDTYSDERGSAAIRALFDLGLFKDVRIDVNGNVLVVIVEERPTIADVDFVGTKEFDKAALQKALREVGLTDGRPYDKALADRAEQELKRQYVSRSLYNAQVVTTVTPIERNRVNLTFTVTEGESARIREVHVVGNKAFSESTLLSLFDQDSGGFMSWYTKSNQYSRAKLNADLETLRSYYITRGYLEFRIDSTQVAISPDRKDLTVTVNITEGEKFVVSSIKLDGNYLGRDDEFKSLITIKPGEAYNGEQVTETTKAFNDYFGTFGYAFARVQARPDIDRVNNRVALTLQAEPARRVYVRKVSVGGNNKTRDEVIRREFRQFEASWYDGDKIKLSRDRVDRLGFFTEVNVDTQEVPGSPDQVDLTVNVAEKPTGSLQLGAGYSSAEKVALTFGISQENVFGSGNFLGVQVNTSKYNRTLSLTTTDPYFTQDGISRTISLYHTTTRPYSSSIDGDYKLVNQGGSIRFGVPFSEIDTVFFGIGLERYAFDANSSTALLRPDHAAVLPELLPVPEGPDGHPGDRLRPEERLGRSVEHRLGPRQPRQRADPDHRPPAARQPRSGCGWRHEVRQDELPVPAVLRDQQAVHLLDQRRSRLCQGAGRQGLPDLQELLRRRPGLDPRLRAELAGSARHSAVRPDRRRGHRRHQEGDLQRRAEHAVPGRRQRPHAAAVRLLRRRQCVRFAFGAA